MATWIVHLRLAENVLELIPDLDAGQFAIGNIAPDSGIPDENWENFDPPSIMTHFLSPEKDWIGSADIDFYQQHLSGVDISERERFSFRLGYFFHLITDNLWRTHIYRPTQERFAEDFSADPKFISKVKKDWYGLDLAYVRDHPECIFWRIFLDAEPDACDLNFLPIKAVRQQLEYIKNFYSEYEKEIEEFYFPPYVYLTQNEVDDFVGETTQRLHRIYQAIWVDPVSVPDKKSFLSTIRRVIL